MLIQLFYDPADGQVMAVYSGDTTSTVWTDRGFLRATSNIRVTRDHRVVVEDGKVVSAAPFINPEQPAEPSLDDVYDAVIKSQRVLKAYILAINDGSIIPGSNMTPADLKAAVKAKM